MAEQPVSSPLMADKVESNKVNVGGNIVLELSTSETTRLLVALQLFCWDTEAVMARDKQRYSNLEIERREAQALYDKLHSKVDALIPVAGQNTGGAV